MELDGETVWVPLGVTGPMPSMVTEVALVVRQLSTTDWPRSMASGSAVRVAVGAGVVSVVGPRLAGFTPLVFLWQPAVLTRTTAMIRAARTEGIREGRAGVLRVRSFLSPRLFRFTIPDLWVTPGLLWGPFYLLLLPAPVGHVGAGAGQGVFLGAVGEHGPDSGVLGAAVGGVGVDDVASVGRPGGEIAAAGVVGELDPLAGGDVDDVDVLARRGSGAVFAIPGEGDELAVGRPRGRGGVALRVAVFAAVRRWAEEPSPFMV